MGKHEREEGHIKSIETIDRAGDGYQVDHVELRDGTFLEVTCEKIRAWWSASEYQDGRRPVHTFGLIPEPISDDAIKVRTRARQEALDALSRYESLTTPEEFQMILARHAVEKLTVPDFPRRKR